MKTRIFFAIVIGIVLGWIFAKILLSFYVCPEGYLKIHDPFNAYADSQGRGFFCAKEAQVNGNQFWSFK